MNGLICVIFEFMYDIWVVGGIYVFEVKCFMVDVGYNFDWIDSMFIGGGNVKEFIVVVGLNKNNVDKG